MFDSRLIRLLIFACFSVVTSSVWSQRNLTEIPDPDPEKERLTFKVADGFEVQLYVSDPDIAKPIHMNFDGQGRLWIASSEVYPHIKPGAPATDKILVVEDTDQDGIADKTTVFADGLLIPTGVVPGDGGAYVVNSTELVHYEDLDGDLKGDVRNVVLSGFGSEDTHHLLHSLRWGPDGALYMNQSIYIHSHVETPHGVRRLRGGGIWRFRPETMELEIVCRGFVNPWGHHFDYWGQSFATDGAYGEGINYVFPGAVYVTAPGLKRRLEGLNPGSPKHCGLEILSGRHLPEDWRGSMVTNDFRAHRVCRFTVSEQGAGYSSRQETEVITSSHTAFRPIDVKMGPDGAIYIADWYNPIIQHGEVDFRDERRDHAHGRIWRITAKDRPLSPRIDPKEVRTKQLVRLLTYPEDWIRLYAKLEMKHRDRDTVSRSLHQRLAQLTGDDEDTLHEKLEILWAFQNINQLPQELVEELARSTDHRVRAAATRVVSNEHERIEGSFSLLEAASLDPSPRVRLEGIRGLSSSQNGQAAEIVLQVLDQPMDRFLDFAAWQTMRDLQTTWKPAIDAGLPALGADPSHIIYALRSVEAKGTGGILIGLAEDMNQDDPRLGGLLELTAELGTAAEVGRAFNLAEALRSESSAEQRAPIEARLAAMLAVSSQRGIVPPQAAQLAGRWLDDESAAIRQTGISAAGDWKIVDMRDDLIALVTDKDQTAAARQKAVGSLGQIADQASRDALALLAMTATDDRLLAAVTTAVAGYDLDAAVACGMKLVGSSDEALFQSTFSNLVARKGGQLALHKAITTSGDLSLSQNDAKRMIRIVRSASEPQADLISAIRDAGSLAESGWKLTPEERTAILSDVLTVGNAARGQAIYRRRSLACVNCHAIGGAGGRVGPDLISIGGSAPIDYLLNSLLLPNDKVKENFHSLIVLTADGKILSGIVIREDDTTLVLRDKDDALLSINKADIDGRREGRSLMPDGTVDELTRQELVDLVRFLSELGKPGDYAVGTRQLARRWSVLVDTPAARTRLRRVGNDSVLNPNQVYEWVSAYSQVNGRLPLANLDTLPRFPDASPVTFTRVSFRVSRAGEIRFGFEDISGLTLWLDGSPIEASKLISVRLDPGLHELTLSIDRSSRASPLAIELLRSGADSGEAQWLTGK